MSTASTIEAREIAMTIGAGDSVSLKRGQTDRAHDVPAGFDEAGLVLISLGLHGDHDEVH